MGKVNLIFLVILIFKSNLLVSSLGGFEDIETEGISLISPLIETQKNLKKQEIDKETFEKKVNEIFPGQIETDIKENFKNEDDKDQENKYHNALISKTSLDEYSDSQKKDKKYEMFKEDYLKLKNNFMSFEQFMSASLFDPEFGYYIKNLKLLTDKEAGQFQTYPHILSPNFGRMIAYQAYAMWLSMLNSKAITLNDNFFIIELGAGYGQLAHDILEGIEIYAKQEANRNINTHWAKFNKAIQYIIGEISPELRKRQTELNLRFIQQGKLKIYNQNARDIKLDSKVKGLILSNELPDTFPVHKIYQKSNGEVKVAILIPILMKNSIAQNNITEEMKKKSSDLKEIILRLAEQDKEFSNLLGKNIIGEPFELISKHTVLTGSDWLKLRREYENDQKYLYKNRYFNSSIVFLEAYIDSSFFPEITNYLLKNSNYIKYLGQSVSSGQLKFWYLNYSLENWLEGVNKILDQGYIMTIDYGDNIQVLKGQMDLPNLAIRTYPLIDSKFEDPYSQPGLVDITTDIDFTYIHLIGKALGWKTIFFGIQSDLQDNYIKVGENKYLVPFDLSNNNFSAFVKQNLTESFKNEKFVMLIQIKNLDSSNYQIMGVQNPIFPKIS